MAKAKKTISPIREGSYGVITEKLANGMFLTNKGNKVPPFTGYKIGDEVLIENGAYKIGDGTSEDVNADAPVTADDIKELKEALAKEKEERKKLEALVGAKGENVKGEADEK